MGQQVVRGAQHRHALDRLWRARQPVIEDPQHVQVAPLQRLADQGLGPPRRPDQHDVRRQRARCPPASDQVAPAHVQAVQADQHQPAPHQPGRPLRFGSEKEPARDQGRRRPGRDNPRHRGQMKRRLLAAGEPVAAQRPHQAQHRQGPESERRQPRRLGVQQRPRRRRPGAQQGDRRHRQHVEGPEIVRRQPRGVPLPGVQPDFGAERPAPGRPRGPCAATLPHGGGGGQRLQSRHVETAGRGGRVGVERKAVRGVGQSRLISGGFVATLHRPSHCRVNGGLPRRITKTRCARTRAPLSTPPAGDVAEWLKATVC